MCELASDVLPLALIQPLLTQAQAQAEKESRSQQAQIARNILLDRDERLLNLINQLAIKDEQIDKIKYFLNQENQALEQETAPDEAVWLLADNETLNQLSNLLNQSLEAKKAAQQQIKILTDREEEIITLERQTQTAASPEDYQKLVDALGEAQNKVAEAKANCETVQRLSLIHI